MTLTSFGNTIPALIAYSSMSSLKAANTTEDVFIPSSWDLCYVTSADRERQLTKIEKVNKVPRRPHLRLKPCEKSNPVKFRVPDHLFSMSSRTLYFVFVCLVLFVYPFQTVWQYPRENWSLLTLNIFMPAYTQLLKRDKETTSPPPPPAQSRLEYQVMSRWNGQLSYAAKEVYFDFFNLIVAFWNQ